VKLTADGVGFSFYMSSSGLVAVGNKDLRTKRMTGTIRERDFNSERGFGFIESGRRSYFVHVSKVIGLPFDESLIGQQVKFDVEATDKGYQAVNVRASEQPNDTSAKDAA
jgi:cold shock CspA family protein